MVTYYNTFLLFHSKDARQWSVMGSSIKCSNMRGEVEGKPFLVIYLRKKMIFDPLGDRFDPQHLQNSQSYPWTEEILASNKEKFSHFSIPPKQNILQHQYRNIYWKSPMSKNKKEMNFT